MREVAIKIASKLDGSAIERSIDEAIADIRLNVTMRGSLKMFPGCIHWHVKRGHETGTLEITFWPQERRAWFTIQDGRKGAWIEEHLKLLSDAIWRHAGDS